jgi:translocation and assembly module TamB
VQVLITDTVALDGTVELEPGGRLPLLGKVFVVQHGRLTFDTGDSANPSIELLASWENKSSDHDATVFVEVRGTARKAKLTLRSAPPLSESQILSLLAGGSTDQGSVVVGAATALGVDALFENTPLRQLQVRVDQSDGTPTYIASLRVSDTVWLEGKYQRRDANRQQQSSTTTKSDAVALALDWRFLREWSVRLEGGNANAGTDLLWTYRY